MQKLLGARLHVDASDNAGGFVPASDVPDRNGQVRTGFVDASRISDRQQLKIFYLDVGQGDASLIEAENAIVIIDGGPNRGFHDELVKRLNSLRAADEAAGLLPRPRLRINAIVVTHFDLDHYFGLVKVLQNDQFEVGRIYHNGLPRYDKSAGHDLNLGDVVNHTDGSRSISTDLRGLDSARDLLSSGDLVTAAGNNNKFAQFLDAAVKAAILAAIHSPSRRRERERPMRPIQARGIALAGLLVAAGGPLVAQQAPPNPLGQPLLDATGQLRDDAFIRIPLRPEDQQYADIEGDRMKGMLLEVDAISLADRNAGTVFWGRNVGTAGHVATQDWVEGYFRRNGLGNIYRQSFDLRPVWHPTAWELTFASGDETFTLDSARPPQGAQSTPPEGLELELVWVGGGSDADYLGRVVAGKAVLIQDIPRPGTLRHSIRDEGAIARAFERGAAAVGIVYGISDNFAVWQRTGDGPGFNVGYEDGMRLRDLLGYGERVTVRYRMESEMRSGLRAASVWGTLPGVSDEEILIIAHMDGYFQSALDNASGLAVMMGLLEHYAKIPYAERPRTLRFLASVGHHGGPGTSWLHDNRDTALANTVLAINLEHVAAVRTKYWGPRLRMTNAVSPMRWWVNGSPTLLDTVLDAFNRFNVGVTADMEGGASGEMGRMARDVPSIQVITSPEIKHTEQDTPEWVPAVGLEQIGRAYAKIIDGIAAVDREDLQPAGAPSSGGA